MSTEYEAGVMLGWFIDLDAFWALCEKREAKTHEEKRFDPKTGEEVDPVTITDEPAGYYWQGEHVEYPEFICQVLGEWLQEKNADIDVVPLQSQWGEVTGIIIGKAVHDMTAYDAGRILGKSGVLFAKVHFKVKGMPKLIPYLILG